MSTVSKATDQAEALEQLRALYRPGDTVTTSVVHVSRSGMSRSIMVLRANRDGTIDNVSRLVARAAGRSWDDQRDAVKVSGCGMDVAFHLTYELSSALWPDGFRCVGERRRCPSSDHANGAPRDGRRKHRDSGYALRKVSV